MGAFRDDPLNNKLVVRLGTGTKMKFIELMDRFDMSPSVLIGYLVDIYEGSTYDLTRIFRHTLSQRLKKGISYQHVEELQKLRDMINLSLKNIEK